MKRKGYPWHFGDIWRSACQYPTSYLNTMPPQYHAASIHCRLNTMPPPHFFAIPTSPPFRLLRHCDCFTIPTASPFRVLRHFDFFNIPTSSPFRLLRHSDFFAIPTSSSFPWDWIQQLVGLSAVCDLSMYFCIAAPGGIVRVNLCFKSNSLISY